jgi:dienelactone hydrolase
MLHKTKIEYVHGNLVLEGYCVVDTTKGGDKPAVIVAHDWSGRNEFACQKAEKLAELGYVGFALDMYGRGQVGKTNEEKMALMKPLMEDRNLLTQRMLVAVETVKRLEIVRASHIAAMGYCFGGACVLDLARSGAEVRGVISVHGLLSAPELPPNQIHAKVLALHGHDDPMVSPEQVALFEKEMTDYAADWQLHIYGHTKHAFANPAAHDHQLGTVYNEVADSRSWQAAKNFLTEIFA